MGIGGLTVRCRRSTRSRRALGAVRMSLGSSFRCLPSSALVWHCLVVQAQDYQWWTSSGRWTCNALTQRLVSSFKGRMARLPEPQRDWTGIDWGTSRLHCGVVWVDGVSLFLTTVSDAYRSSHDYWIRIDFSLVSCVVHSVYLREVSRHCRVR